MKIKSLLRRAITKFRPFAGSEAYWRERYRTYGTSGVGSYGKFASFKADVLNDFVIQYGIRSVIEFGCGDGNQLALARYPSYLGFDVSELAIDKCRDQFPRHRFKLMRDYDGERADLAMSLDVIYHLVEDEIFASYMRTLFSAAGKYVVIYSSNYDGRQDKHVRHREFTKWINAYANDWKLLSHTPNRYPYRGDHLSGSFADFYFWQRN